ncbi:MAG TPA: PilZ domain-containing protein [Candidatus Krumholzibacterium sp.]|nr:PilZ domain-containing protein [Candidatus Krumholzibacterium sp.]
MQGPIDDRRISGRRCQERGRRRYPRVRMGYEGFYVSPDRMIILKGGNLTLRGAFLATPGPDPSGTQATLLLLLPGNITMARIPVRVVWSNEDPDFGPVGMGLKFEGAAPWQLRRLASSMIKVAGLKTFPWLEEESEHLESCPSEGSKPWPG